MTLKELEIGAVARITAIGGEGARRQHFLDMGLIPGTTVRMIKHAPMGDPVEVMLHSYSLTLRKSDAEEINIEPQTDDNYTTSCHSDSTAYLEHLHDHNAHPGLGEMGVYHTKDDEHPLPKETTLTFGLAGQQNCGKTTLFNLLTGSNQHVGNFPGVTIDRKDGAIKGHPNTRITDLPGIYSLSPYTAEERVSRQFLLKEHPHCIINVVDATNIERHLYLTMQLMELDIPMVLALNMMDELRNNGGSIRVNEMERLLGIPVVPISAAKNEGIEELVEHALHIAHYQERPLMQDFCSADDHGGAVHNCLHGIMDDIATHAEAAQLPLRFSADKLAEGDAEVQEALQLDATTTDSINQRIARMEQERGLDRAAAIADMRFHYIEHLCAHTVVKPRESKEALRSRKMDKVLTGRFTAIPLFITLMALIIWLSIDFIGVPLQDGLQQCIDWLANLTAGAMERWHVGTGIQSLVTDGLFGGVGSVVSFVPIIIVLFFFLSLLEDSGYMARVAFVTDKLLRHIGLTGHSIVPMIIGFGCTVPSVMATRTLPSSRDRRMTILMTPFMSCSAKIPIYVFLATTFFPRHGGLVLAGLYLLGIATGVTMALVVKMSHRNERPAPFVMELPNYRMPQPRNVGHLLWDRTKDFLQRAFSIILIASLVIWFLQTFNFRLQMVDEGDSILAWIANLLTPLFRPIGLGHWQLVTALVSGFLAKESVVATMGVLDCATLLTPASALAMMVFCLLYTPCVAAIAAIRRELGGKWAFFVVIYQCVIAWLLAGATWLLASWMLG